MKRPAPTPSDLLAQAAAIQRRQLDARAAGQPARLTDQERAILEATKADRLKLARRAAIEKKFAAGHRLSPDQLALIGIEQTAAAQNQDIPLPPSNGFPVYDSMEQCAAACKINLIALKDAKRNGCPAFRSNRVYSGDLLAYFANERTSEFINIQAEKARLTRAEADLAEKELLFKDEQVANFEEIKKVVSETLILPLRQWKQNMANAYALHCNPDKPAQARAALRQAEADLERLLATAIPKPK